MYFDTDHDTQEHSFIQNLPGTLYFSHYELAMHFPKWTADEWRRYLKENERFIMMEIAAITEANARQALSRLSTGKLTAQDVAAIKQLLERSEQINSQDRDQRTFIMLQFDGTPVGTGDDGMITREKRQQIMQENASNYRKLYGLDEMSIDERQAFRKKDYMVMNGDGTYHFKDTDHMDQLDKAYMRLYNPTNVYSADPVQLTADEVDVQ